MDENRRHSEKKERQQPGLEMKRIISGILMTERPLKHTGPHRGESYQRRMGSAASDGEDSRWGHPDSGEASMRTLKTRLSFPLDSGILCSRGFSDVSHPDGLHKATDILLSAERVVTLTGAGVSAESGIPTFRGKEGLWKTYRAEQLATPTAFIKDPALVWEWYDWRRSLIAAKEPNPAHATLAAWESLFPEFTLITQNIDGLHQKAGSKNVIELHGNIWKQRCIEEQIVIENHDVPLKEIPPHCPECGGLLRPHVVWFGEALDGAVLQKSFLLSEACDTFLVIGTSAVVQPAASLPLRATESQARLIEVNPDPTPVTPYADVSVRSKAGEFLPLLDSEFRSHRPRESG
ncbi:MAG: NAD-dependent deacylase [Candidatus Aminicenantales bacterium]